MDPSTTQIVVASIAAGASILTAVIGVQLKVHADNRKDHAETAHKVNTLVDVVGEVREDVRDIKTDVRVLKADVRDLELHEADTDGRLDRLEGQA